MTAARRAMITKELAKAQSALGNAFLMAANEGDLELAASIRKQVRATAEALTCVNGGPLKIHVTELLRT